MAQDFEERPPDEAYGIDAASDSGAVAAPDRPPRRIPAALPLVLLVLAAFGAGLVFGWFLLGRIDPPQAAAEAVEVADEAPAGVDVIMPDIRGLSESTARTALADSGIPADKITVAIRPAAGPSGVVTEQEPVYGTANPDQVTLTVSSPAAVPDVVGLSEEAASAELIALGARVEVQRAYDPAKQPGEVIGTSPATGEPVGEAVVLTVSEAPASVYLSQLDGLAGSPSCRNAAVVVSGREYENSVNCSADEKPTAYGWLLGGKVTSFQAVIGVADDGEQDAAASVEVLVDGRPVATGSVAYTQALPVDVSVAGATQLQVRLTRAGGDPDSYSETPVILADARFIGSSAGIGELAGWGQ